MGRVTLTEDRSAEVFEFLDASPKHIVKSGLVLNWLTLAPIAER
jgi:hypothetical protein